jgi:hypothetical protein
MAMLSFAASDCTYSRRTRYARYSDRTVLVHDNNGYYSKANEGEDIDKAATLPKPDRSELRNASLRDDVNAMQV